MYIFVLMAQVQILWKLVPSSGQYISYSSESALLALNSQKNIIVQ